MAQMAMTHAQCSIMVLRIPHRIHRMAIGAVDVAPRILRTITALAEVGTIRLMGATEVEVLIRITVVVVEARMDLLEEVGRGVVVDSTRLYIHYERCSDPIIQTLVLMCMLVCVERELPNREVDPKSSRVSLILLSPSLVSIYLVLRLGVLLGMAIMVLLCEICSYLRFCFHWIRHRTLDVAQC